MGKDKKDRVIKITEKHCGNVFVEYEDKILPSDAILVLVKHGNYLTNVSRGKIENLARLIMGNYVIAYDKAQGGSGHDAHFVELMEHIAEDILRMRNLRESDSPQQLIERIEKNQREGDRARKEIIEREGLDASNVIDFPVKKKGDDDETIH